MNILSAAPKDIVQIFAFFVVMITIIVGTASADTDTAATGDTVSVYYSLSFPGGPVFETNVNTTPLTFTLGSGAMISGFDAAIHGMKPGETKTVILPPEEAYGSNNISLIRTVPFHEAVDLLDTMNMSNVSISLIPGYPGPIIEYVPPEGKRQRYVFTNITNTTVTLDTNKPLTDRSLQFEIILDEVKKSG